MSYLYILYIISSCTLYLRQAPLPWTRPVVPPPCTSVFCLDTRPISPCIVSLHLCISCILFNILPNTSVSYYIAWIPGALNYTILYIIPYCTEILTYSLSPEQLLPTQYDLCIFYLHILYYHYILCIPRMHQLHMFNIFTVRKLS